MNDETYHEDRRGVSEHATPQSGRAVTWSVFPLLIALIAGLSSPFLAAASGTHNDDHAKMAANNTKSHKATGTVNKLNPDGTVNITHGPVASLGWPGMAMDFQVKDKALLKGIKPGQKISFEIGKEASGYVITAISAAK